jgi:hypothetical protein
MEAPGTGPNPTGRHGVQSEQALRHVETKLLVELPRQPLLAPTHLLLSGDLALRARSDSIGSSREGACRYFRYFCYIGLFTYSLLIALTYSPKSGLNSL